MTRDTALFEQAAPSVWERVWESESRQSYWIARFLILRLLGLVYFVGFLTIVNDGLALYGSDGLTPAASYLERVEEAAGTPSRASGFVRLPTVFWRSVSDGFLMRIAWLGLALSLLVTLGYANAILLTLLWFLYMSFVHIGQGWYAFGWEIQLLETGFLAIFLCPLFDGRPFPGRPPPVVVIWLYRWLIFRIMLGAGLIKLRGDACWRDLTCLVYHYETQPVPNPFSAPLHFMPVWFHKLGALFNYLVELVVPFFAFGPRRACHVAGIVMVSLQLMLIASGNLSFLNWLTIIPALACFDDSFFERWIAPRWLERRRRAPLHRGQQAVALVLVLVVALLSVGPVLNLVSSRQIMNTSFDRLHLVNTYGAFGSVGRERLELVVQGSDDSATWRDYEFKCKPTQLDRRPCVITPYHYRLDWLMWFAAMGRVEQYPWAAHLVWKLLQDDRATLRLIETNPFSEAPPRSIRIELYRYEFTQPGESGWWKRERVSTWLGETSLRDATLREFLRKNGWAVP